MKMLRYLFAIALVCGLTRVAKADDFQMVVADPTPSLVPTPNEVHAITSDDFSVTLSACNANQLDGLSPDLYLGCFTGLNLTGAPLTSLDVLIPVFDINGVQDTPGCPDISEDVFKGTPTCGVSGSYFYVDLTDGALPTAAHNGDCDNDGDAGGLNQDDINCDTGSIFTIAVGFGTYCDGKKDCKEETKLIESDFADTTADANVIVTPEPSSILLMSTGVFSLGLFGAYRRRQILGEPLPSPGRKLD
jgi:hypothetical protein